MRGRGKSGNDYFYFFCQGRLRHTCDLPYMPVARVESAVLDHYTTITLTADLRARIAAGVDAVRADSGGETAELTTRVKAELARLNTHEDRYLDLVGDPDWPQDKIAARLRKIRDERSRLARQLDETATPGLGDGAEAMAHLLELLAELYRNAGKHARQVFNRTFFSRIYLDGNDDGPDAAADE
jgi:hypothetical protein